MNSVRSLNRWYSSRSRCTDSVAVYSEVFETYSIHLLFYTRHLITQKKMNKSGPYIRKRALTLLFCMAMPFYKIVC